jgi:hypothetical protein
MSLVVYKLNGSPYQDGEVADAEKRKQGMADAGALIQQKLTAVDAVPKEAISDAIKELIMAQSMGAPVYMVRYEYVNNSGVTKFRVLQHLGSQDGDPIDLIYPIYRVEANGTLSPLGFLKLDIDKDIKVRSTHEMSIIVPRRGQNPDAWSYIDQILDDLEVTRRVGESPADFQARRERYRKYLIGRAMISRCR